MFVGVRSKPMNLLSLSRLVLFASIAVYSGLSLSGADQPALPTFDEPRFVIEHIPDADIVRDNNGKNFSFYSKGVIRGCELEVVVNVLTGIGIANDDFCSRMDMNKSTELVGGSTTFQSLDQSAKLGGERAVSIWAKKKDGSRVVKAVACVKFDAMYQVMIIIDSAVPADKAKEFASAFVESFHFTETSEEKQRRILAEARHAQEMANAAAAKRKADFEAAAAARASARYKK
jgi:hypothetical protein